MCQMNKEINKKDGYMQNKQEGAINLEELTLSSVRDELYLINIESQVKHEG